MNGSFSAVLRKRVSSSVERDGLKGQQLSAQGSALGIVGFHMGFRAVSAKAFALSGRSFSCTIPPRALPWADGCWPFRPSLSPLELARFRSAVEKEPFITFLNHSQPFLTFRSAAEKELSTLNSQHSTFK